MFASCSRAETKIPTCNAILRQCILNRNSGGVVHDRPAKATKRCLSTRICFERIFWFRFPLNRIESSLSSRLAFVLVNTEIRMKMNLLSSSEMVIHKSTLLTRYFLSYPIENNLMLLSHLLLFALRFYTRCPYTRCVWPVLQDRRRLFRVPKVLSIAQVIQFTLYLPVADI